MDINNVAELTNPPEEAASPKPPVRRLGDILLERGLVTIDQLDIALREKNRRGQMLGEVLVDMGFISSGELSALLSETSGVGRLDPANAQLDPDIVNLVPKDMATRLRAVPLSQSDNEIQLAMVDPQDILAIDEVRRLLPKSAQLRPMMCTETDFNSLIDRAYAYALSLDGILKELENSEQSSQGILSSGGTQDFKHPLVRLVDAILLDAVKVGASDIHIEPEEFFVRLRYRIDGVMSQIRNFDRELMPALILRLKLMAGMNIADRLSAQDGRFQIRYGNRQIDYRVSSLPSIHGENIVLRVLDQSNTVRGLDQLQLSPHNKALIEKALLRPQGIIIATGPTGSGKTTTLYSLLGIVNTPEVNIMTLEDPVEYEVPLLRQTQIREASGLTFSNGVRALMRQDPDIVFIGEIRDDDTAQMTVRAAMTGHRVFSTLHTNDCFGVLPRLYDFGLPPALIAGSIVAVIAQRLVRSLCPRCKEAYQPGERERKILGLDAGFNQSIYRAVGCHDCRNTGYRGRLSVMEILMVDEAIDDLINQKPTRRKSKQPRAPMDFSPCWWTASGGSLREKRALKVLYRLST